LLCLELLLLLPLLIQELAVISYLTNRWISAWRDLYQVELKVSGNLQCLLQADDSCVLDVFSNNTNNTGTDFFIDPEFFPQLIPLPGCPFWFGLVNSDILLFFR
jgi:hypothetical protein